MMAVQKYHAVLIHEVQKFLCYELEDGGKWKRGHFRFPKTKVKLDVGCIPTVDQPYKTRKFTNRWLFLCVPSFAWQLLKIHTNITFLITSAVRFREQGSFEWFILPPISVY
jgi:hypothetical protein